MRKSPKKTTKKVTKNTVKKVAPKKVAAKKAVVKKAKKVVKPKEIVIVSPVDPNSRITIASELADDEMIERELMGEVLPYYIYQFCESGCKPADVEAGKCSHKKTVGMTVKGVNEVVRNLNKKKDSGVTIRINPTHMKIEHNVDEEGVKGVQVSVYAENLVDGNSAWGIKFEPYNKLKRDGSSYKNEFAAEKALSKAERNAKRKLIPETMALKMIQLMLKNPEGVRALQTPNSQARVTAAAPPKPSTQEEVQQLIRSAIAHSNEIDRVLEFDRKTQEDKRFGKDFKAEVRKLAAARVDTLQNK